MKKISFLLTGTIFLCGLLINHSIGNEPINDFIHQVLKEQQEDNFQYWRGMGNQPPGCYLYRFNLDIDGDGVEELFLSSSLHADRQSKWNIYQNQSDNNYRLITSNLLLHPRGIYLSTNNSEVVMQIIRGRPQEGVNITSYYFNRDGLVRESTRELKREELALLDEPDWATQLKMGTLAEPEKVEKILLGEYIKNPKAQWRNFNYEFAIQQQYLDPADTNAIKQVENFTSQEGRRLLEQMEKQGNENQTINQPTTPTTSIPQNNQNNQTSKITSFNNWPLIGWIGLGAVVVGLVTYLLLKK